MKPLKGPFCSAMHTFICLEMHLPMHACTGTRARTNAPFVQLVLVCNEARGIRLCNMLQMATASLHNVLYVVLSALSHLSGHTWGKANRELLYFCCCVVLVYIYVCMCACYVHASHKLLHRPSQSPWNCALMDEKGKVNQFPNKMVTSNTHNVYTIQYNSKSICRHSKHFSILFFCLFFLWLEGLAHHNC